MGIHWNTEATLRLDIQIPRDETPSEFRKRSLKHRQVPLQFQYTLHPITQEPERRMDPVTQHESG